MAEKRDYYEVLGVGRDAGEDEIKKAFRQKAKQLHPDLHPGDKAAEAEFKEVNEAYEVLSDPQKKAQYDQFGHEGPQGAGFGGFGGGFGDMGDIFDMFTGGMFGGRRRRGPTQGDSLRYELTLSFEEAAFGCTKEINVVRNEACEACNGTGAAGGSARKTCSTCHGTGRVQTTVRTPLGNMVSERTCPDCNGEGTIVEKPCTECSGHGKVRRKRTISVKVPAGIDDGQTINLRGEGEPGTLGGPNGDLYVEISVRKHAMFRRDGYNLSMDMPISYAQAVLGATVEVPTLEGKVNMNIPEGTQTGTNFRLEGKGIQRLNARGKGDLFVRVKIEVPQKLSSKQKDLLRAFDEEIGNKQYKDRRSFLEKMKDLFS